MALVLLSWKAAAAELCCSTDTGQPGRSCRGWGWGQRSWPRELFTLRGKKQCENVSLL